MATGHHLAGNGVYRWEYYDEHATSNMATRVHVTRWVLLIWSGCMFWETLV